MRTIFNAERSWKFTVDDDTTEKVVGVSHSDIYGANSAGRAPGAAGFYCNDDDWRTVDLPHDRRVEVACDGYESATVEFDVLPLEQDIYLAESDGSRKINEVIISNDTFKEKPDPNMVLDDTDMNNFVVWDMGIRGGEHEFSLGFED